MANLKPTDTPVAPAATDESVSTFLAKLRAMAPATIQGVARGRLVFAMDATMSRQPTWDRALAIQSQMFGETQKIGGLDVQLVYFRGLSECRASKWVSEPQALARLMTTVQCHGGYTQIGRVLKHVKKEAQSIKINAAVYVGDAMEENIDALCKTAGEIGLLGVPLFLFQEGSDTAVETAFRELARLTRGAYFRLDSASAKMLRDLLTAVAVYAAGGRAALEARNADRGTTLLLRQLGP